MTFASGFIAGVIVTLLAALAIFTADILRQIRVEKAFLESHDKPRFLDPCVPDPRPGYRRGLGADAQGADSEGEGGGVPDGH